MKVKPVRLRKAVWIAAAIGLMVAGLLLTPLPVPLPLGLVTFLLGCAILITHSKGFRRLVQYLRHKNDWLSRATDYAMHRAPQKIRQVFHRTKPHALHRHARLKRKRTKG